MSLLTGDVAPGSAAGTGHGPGTVSEFSGGAGHSSDAWQTAAAQQTSGFRIDLPAA